MSQITDFRKFTPAIRYFIQACLVGFPLAVAGLAHAGTVTILPTSNPGCYDFTSSYGNGGTCSITATQLAASNNIEGVNLSLNGSATDFSSSDSGMVTLSVSGALSGSLQPGTVIPFDYSFTLSGNPTTWKLEVQIAEEGGNDEEANAYINGSGGGTFSGIGAITIPGGFDPNGSGERVQVDPTLSYSHGDASEVISGFSVDVNSVPGASTPEPASATLLVAGMSLLGWIRIRRNSRSRSE